MAATDGGEKMNRNGDKSGGFYKNNGPADAVRSKIAALLDDVTVTDRAPVIPATPAITDNSSTIGNTNGVETPRTFKAEPLISEQQTKAPTENSAVPSGAVASTPPSAPPLPPSSSLPGASLWDTPVPNITAPVKPPQALATAPLTSQTGVTSPVDSARNQNSNQVISIKGRTDGVAIEIGKGQWADLLSELEIRLTEASDFFRGGRVALDLGARPLLEEELTQVHDLLQKVGLKLGIVRTKSQRTFQAALNLGLSTRLEPGGDAESAAAQGAGSNRETEQHFVYRGNLRSGQVLQKHEHILVIGDVNPGAEVISAGDIFVWGRLRGIAHAGADGDAQAVIVAFDLDPVQLQIMDIAGSIPEEPSGFTGRLLKKRRVVNRPQIVYLNGKQLVIEPWDESRPGGIAAFRR
ncbi:MAG: septum site-determining protein MinC [Chloroflexi bacterium]|nr:septum site-determining protein MinC [Chloroflexota bacterium]